MTDAAQKIAERVPLPEPVVVAEHRFNWPEVCKIEGYTADQLRAYGLAVAEEALRGAEAVASTMSEAAEVLGAIVDSGAQLPESWRWHLIDELSGFAAMLRGGVAPPAGSVEAAAAEYVSARDAYDDATMPTSQHGQPKRLKRSDPVLLRYIEARAALTAALQEPGNGK